ncbi:MAG: ribonuclease HII [Chloroflexi bacterium RBG_16_57_8]|nr:MAG: ribonuclease HII [Chloroflexi bacterium RBG_16_57_8]
MSNPRLPTFAEEKRFRRQGYRSIAGIDEVGRGALAGPVVAAAVIMPADIKAPWRKKVRDSKLLSPAQRDFLFGPVQEAAIAVGVGSVDCWSIESIGIARATQVAMTQAIKQLSPPPDAVLIDYFTLPDLKLPQKGVTDGDTLCFSIACASIIAKVTRDRMMVEFDGTYPGYLFAEHKGYGTEEHIACLRRLGPCPIHRRTFGPVKDVLEPRA